MGEGRGMQDDKQVAKRGAAGRRKIDSTVKAKTNTANEWHQAELRVLKP